MKDHDHRSQQQCAATITDHPSPITKIMMDHDHRRRVAAAVCGLAVPV